MRTIALLGRAKVHMEMAWRGTRGCALIALATIVGALAPNAALAQRRPVLPQIAVPHPYYFRELYLPQLTTGPSSVAWTHDGTALVYSARGSLWRQTLGSDEAVQLTDNAGYDHQPDCSPDGRWIVYTTYTGDAIDLSILDLRSGLSRKLLADGAVNVEPRWSPDGSQLAWVSTAFNGRFHIYVADVHDGSLGTPTRVSDDVDSGLPRYYYSPFDHTISPAWSADGKSLVVVSNTGRIWGTGGIWRLALDSLTSPTHAKRELHFEETNWKARPDVSRDGKRIVYASYAGRQWHQLALLSADTSAHEAPIQITYGDFDATNPRWSPDGRRIAYISNERGNTSLWTVDVPGGARRESVASRRRWMRPVGTLRLIATEASLGTVVPARLSVRTEDGRHFAPDDAWMHADDGFDRAQRKFEFAYFHADRPTLVTLPVGTATVEAMRGHEYAPFEAKVGVRAGETTTVRIPLKRLTNLARQGWVSGDLHVHMNYGGTYRNTPGNLVRQGRAEDLRLIENLVVNKEGRIPDIASFTTAPDRASTPDMLLVHNEEFHSSYWGHTGLLLLGDHLQLPVYSAYAGTAATTLAPLNADVLREARAQGGVTGYVHPFDAVPAPNDTSRRLTNEFPVDLALGLIDYYEAIGFVDDFMATQRVWYTALNAGFRLPAGAGTDAMANYASLRGPVGMNRVYAKVAGPFSQRTFLEAVKAGRTFVTNGPLLQFTIDGQGPGSTITLARSSQKLRSRISMRSMVGVDSVEIVRNGEVIARLRSSLGGTRVDTTLTLEAQTSGWYVLRAWSVGGRHPVLDLQPFATTSPIYVTVAGAPIRSALDAEYFVGWIMRLRANVLAFTGWNDASERKKALETIDAALVTMRERAAQ